NGLGVARRHGDGLASPDRDLLVAADRLGAIGPDRGGLVAADRDRLVDGDVAAAVVEHVLPQVVVDRGVHVVLAVDPDQLLAGGVVEDHLVVAAPLVRLRLGAADDLLVRQAVGGHLLSIVDAARDQGAVGISFEEVDDDLLAHPGYDHGAEPLAGHLLGDADPARALLVFLALAVPEELDLYPAVLVDVDLLAWRPGHHRRLRPLDHRLGRGSRRAKRYRGRNAGEHVAVTGARRAASVAGLSRRVLDRGDHVGAVLGSHPVAFERELAAGGEGAALAATGRHIKAHLLLFHADLRHRFSLRLQKVLAGIVEDLVLLGVGEVDHRPGAGQ